MEDERGVVVGFFFLLLFFLGCWWHLHGVCIQLRWRWDFVLCIYLDTHTLISSESKHSIQEQLEGRYLTPVVTLAVSICVSSTKSPVESFSSREWTLRYRRHEKQPSGAS